MRIALFGYNFPHKKTQDFILRLFLENADIKVVFAADPVKLNIPKSTIKTGLRHGGLVHPKSISDRIGVRYEVVNHNGPEVLRIIEEELIDVAIIAGARIIKGPVLSKLRYGLINFHPGKIPEARGLDAMLWSIYEGHPLGVTAHIIDERIDAGRILMWREIQLNPDDTLIDLSSRLLDVQIEMLPDVLRIISGGSLPLPIRTDAKLHRKMPPELEACVPKILANRLHQLHTDSQKHAT